MRIISAVVLGYLAMAVTVFAGLTVAYVAIGPERAFRAGAFDVSLMWVAISVVVGLGAALLGGWLARTVSRTPRGPQWLAGVVLVLGLALALPALLSDPAAAVARTDVLGPFEAMMQARTPVWMMLVNPFIGVIGVLLGGRALGGGASGAPVVAS
jgi:hypothetical protein